MSIKLVAIDVDGTLLNSANQITPAVKEMLQAKKQAGTKIVICTGRPIIGIQQFIEEIGLSTVEDYSITYNGSLVQNNASGKVISKHTLTYQDFLDIEYLSRKLGVHLHIQDREAMYTCNRDISKYTIEESYLTGIPLNYRAADEISKEMLISKMMMIDDPEILDQAISQIPAEYHQRFNLVKSSPYFLEVLNKEASKGAALKDLTEYLGIKPEETMAIGDNDNDLSMIEWAGTGIAMGNATDKIKQAATHISKTNDEDGVAYALETWA